MRSIWCIYTAYCSPSCSFSAEIGPRKLGVAHVDMAPNISLKLVIVTAVLGLLACQAATADTRANLKLRKLLDDGNGRGRGDGGIKAEDSNGSSHDGSTDIFKHDGKANATACDDLLSWCKDGTSKGSIKMDGVSCDDMHGWCKKLVTTTCDTIASNRSVEDSSAPSPDDSHHMVPNNTTGASPSTSPSHSPDDSHSSSPDDNPSSSPDDNPSSHHDDNPSSHHGDSPQASPDNSPRVASDDSPKGSPSSPHMSFAELIASFGK